MSRLFVYHNPPIPTNQLTFLPGQCYHLAEASRALRKKENGSVVVDLVCRYTTQGIKRNLKYMGNGKKMGNNETPNWQPISALPMFAYIIDEMLRENQEQYKTLSEAKSKPHVLDDDTVDRVHSVYTT